MHVKLKHPLMIAVLLWSLFPAAPLYAQNDQTPATVPAAAPVESVEQQPVAVGNELTVIELFSSQACIFCPKADALFAELVKSDNVIGLSCHVDYFDVKAGSLARPFCTARQNWYMQALGAGPNYTPQIVVNGSYDVVGYNADAVKSTIKKAQAYPPIDIIVSKGAAGDEYTLSWPAPTTTEAEPALLWVMLLDKPHDLDITEGRNKGQRMSYVNIVSDIEDRGDWKQAEPNKNVEVTLKPEHAGFVVIAQSRKDGKILAAGQYKKVQ